MATISRTKTWVSAEVLTAADLNAEFDAILSDYNGGITNANIAAGAAITSTKISGTAVTLTGSETLTNKTLTAPVISTISNTGVVTLPTSTDTLVGKATTDTLTNKRITKRVGTSASAATHTIDSDSYDMYTVTAQAEAVTFGAPTGTPTQGQILIIRITDNGTARAITWNAIFRDGDLPLPTTTVVSQTMYLGFIYSTTSTKWDLVALVDNVS